MKLDPRSTFFSLHEIAHFLIKRCTFFGSGKIFGSGATGRSFRRPALSNYYSTEWEPLTAFAAQPVWGIFAFATLPLDWVTCFSGIWRAQRGENFAGTTLDSADAKNMKVE